MYDNLIQTALFQALAPALTSYQQDGSARLYFVEAPSGTIAPYAVFQWQSAFNPVRRIGRAGVEVLVLLKSFAPTLPAARAMQAAMVSIDALGEPIIPALSSAGYDIYAEYDSSPPLPYDGTMCQVGDIFRITVWKD